MFKRKIAKDLNTGLSYLSFLYEIQQSNLLFYTELIKVKRIAVSSFEKCFMHSIEQKAHKHFESLKISKSKKYSTEAESIMDKKQRDLALRDRSI